MGEEEIQQLELRLQRHLQDDSSESEYESDLGLGLGVPASNAKSFRQQPGNIFAVLVAGSSGYGNYRHQVCTDISIYASDTTTMGIVQKYHVKKNGQKSTHWYYVLGTA
jgi:hypothetical protein